MSESIPATPYSIQRLPEEERPRERLLRQGAEAMSTSELIAIILGSGMKGMPVLQLAQEIIMHFGSIQGLAEASIQELCRIKGLGPAKALQLKAAVSLGLRVARHIPTAKYRIEHPVHAYNLVKDELQYEKQELFMVILQDTKSYVLSHHIVSIGTISNTLVHPREIFHHAIRHHAASIILVHNHPSGDPSPSPQDYEITRTLIGAGRLIGIPINDHLIIGNPGFISLREKGFSFA